MPTKTAPAKASKAKTTKAAASAKPAAKAAARPAAARSAAKTAAPELVATRQLAIELAEREHLTQRQAGEILGAVVDMLTEHLRRGARVRISGFGTLEVRNRPARMGRNPATGQPIQIKASKKIAFRPAKELKTAV
jgi:DNA-binding protein HU-beta